MTPLETAQKASELTDRALFLAAIICLVLAFTYFLRATARYFIKQHEIVVEAHFKERQQCFVEIKSLQDERKAENSSMTRCLEANTIAVSANTEILRRVNDRLMERNT